MPTLFSRSVWSAPAAKCVKGFSIKQAMNSTLAMIIVPTCHCSAIALQQNRVPSFCRYLCVGGSTINQAWYSTLVMIIAPVCHCNANALQQKRVERSCS
mmetsp:Transcript_25282/g.57352  ORF Transcript_25282/g.57352 Transcript_25282/m.57352 type:complete len:99 (+) Transcript_25282:130-426(+)